MKESFSYAGEAEPMSQRIPDTGPQRERLREKGQFWTPDWIAEAMVAYVLGGDSDHLFDPAVGGGAFFRAAKKVVGERNRRIRLLGTEIDEAVLNQAQESGLSRVDLRSVQIRDFVLDPPKGPYQAIVANPPYIRHHRLSVEVKGKLRAFCAALMGRVIDGRAGLHVFFLLRALQLLGPGGRLAFIMPADTCEGVFAPALWSWIANRYRLEEVITFAPDASPFPKVDTNPLIFLISHDSPTDNVTWVRCEQKIPEQLRAWISDSPTFVRAYPALSVYRRSLSEALQTGLSRMPPSENANGPTLGEFASVRRGIATGANDFFFLTSEQVKSIRIPEEFLVSAVGRTRDVDGTEITPRLMRELSDKGRATWLLSIADQSVHGLPSTVREYLREGERRRIPTKALVSTRTPWYKMERRQAPPILFAYLGRRNCRFIRNRAGVVPLTGFLCIYPHRTDEDFIDRLFKVLNHPETIANLSFVGKSYGGGAIKVEPRALERLRLSPTGILEAELSSGMKDQQLELNYEKIERHTLVGTN